MKAQVEDLGFLNPPKGPPPDFHEGRQQPPVAQQVGWGKELGGDRPGGEERFQPKADELGSEGGGELR